MGDVFMAATRLTDIPRPEFPSGMSVRAYRPGDAATWTRIHEDTGFYGTLPAGLHEREFGRDDTALAERQLFVVDAEGHDIATATAWFNDPAHGLPGGRLHWVAVVPAAQRMGVASALVGAVAARFEALGETAAYLTTDSHNTRAIALYGFLGFRSVRQ
jgi:ribosomal protein S18 acetylase RimI-like enzyme